MTFSKLASLSLLGLALAACQSSTTAVSADPATKTSETTKAATTTNGAKEPCAEHAGAAADARPTATTTGSATVLGAPLSPTTPKVTLAELVKKPGAYADKTIQTEGTVTSVCQARGCWLELGDDSGTAHVKLGSHEFFAPRSSNGKRARVEATVLPAVDSGHCEEEAQEQTGKVAKVELVATGVELF